MALTNAQKKAAIARLRKLTDEHKKKLREITKDEIAKGGDAFRLNAKLTGELDRADTDLEAAIRKVNEF